MLKLAADENFHGELYDRLRSHLPNLDLVRIQDTAVAGAEDEKVLEWVAEAGRILLTHDKRTIVPLFYSRFSHNQRIPGVFMVSTRSGLDLITRDLLLKIQASSNEEWESKLVYIPF